MKNISAIFIKQIKDTLKNKTTLIQFIMFPILAVIMENSVKIENMPEHFFSKLFAVMFVGMAPLTCMSSIISEEKEKGTLRVLMMSNVSPLEYLAGVGAYVWTVCMAGSVVFGVLGNYDAKEFILFMAVMAAGVLLSVMIGAIIGILCKNQMAATSAAIPVMMIFSFMPMLSMFNKTISKAAEFFYTQQLNKIINSIGNKDIEPIGIVIAAVNFIAAVIVFVMSYKRNGLE